MALKIPSPIPSVWWQNQPDRCGRSTARLAAYEGEVPQIVAALSGCPARALEAGPAGEPGVGARTGRPGAGRGNGNPGPGETPRTDPGHGGTAGVSAPKTFRPDQAGGNFLRGSHHPHRENASQRAGSRRATEKIH